MLCCSVGPHLLLCLLVLFWFQVLARFLHCLDTASCNHFKTLFSILTYWYVWYLQTLLILYFLFISFFLSLFRGAESCPLGRLANPLGWFTSSLVCLCLGCFEYTSEYMVAPLDTH